MTGTVRIKDLLALLKAAGESTRLRILVLLAAGELNVKDLTRVLAQSQPRISRHLRLLVEAGLIERFREGGSVYFRLAEADTGAEIAGALLEAIERADPVLVRDRERAEQVKRERAEVAQAYFDAHAADWDGIRARHVAEAEVEAAMREALGDGPFETLVDLGTGTGRTLELFADRTRHGIGIDLNRAMLAYARAKLERAGHRHLRVRLGDLYDPPLLEGKADAVVVHQVLHFLDDPARAVREAARLLKPGGRLLIVDFAPHELEFLRGELAHSRLGFAADQVGQWLGQAGLELGAQRNLVPMGDAREGKLTVSLWLGIKPELERPSAQHSGKMGVAA
jgi:ArsR family transcriptional regulator